MKTWPIWSKEPPEFPRFYDETEACLVLEEEVTVEAGDETVSGGFDPSGARDRQECLSS